MMKVLAILLITFLMAIASDPQNAFKSNPIKEDSVIIYVSEERVAEESHKYSFEIVNNSPHDLGRILFGIDPESGNAQFNGNWNDIKSETPEGWHYGHRLREEGERYIFFFEPIDMPRIAFPIKPGDRLSGFSVTLTHPDTTHRNCFFKISTHFNIEDLKIRYTKGKVTFKPSN